MIIEIPLTLNSFDLEYVIYSHGWVFLSPFELTNDNVGFGRTDKLDKGKSVHYKISTAFNSSVLKIYVETSEDLHPSEQKFLIGRVRYMLRLDEDYTSFYEQCQKRNQLLNTMERGGGRLLRGATVFEDLVKTLCTTNTSWTNTKKMVLSLVNNVGEGVFPTSEDILKFGYNRLISEIGLGYRSDYLFELCEKIESGVFNIDQDFLLALDGDELWKTIKSIRGFGDYATNHMMVMLGKYNRIPFDSEVRSYYKDVFNLSTDRLTEADDPYYDWGSWKYLAYKFDRIERKNNFIDA